MTQLNRTEKRSFETEEQVSGGRLTGLCQNCRMMRYWTVQTPTKKPDGCIREVLHMDHKATIRIRATK